MARSPGITATAFMRHGLKTAGQSIHAYLAKINPHQVLANNPVLILSQALLFTERVPPSSNIL
eukprot:1159507-Pelagomonas_calceolata.AAC.1